MTIEKPVTGEIVLYIERPFRIFIKEVSVFDNNHYIIGHVRKRAFNPLETGYSILDETGRERYRILGSAFNPIHFEIETRNTVRENDPNDNGIISRKITQLNMKYILIKNGLDMTLMAFIFPK